VTHSLPDIDFFQAAFENAAVGMARVGLDGAIREVNATFRTFLGYEKSQLIGKLFVMLLHPDDAGIWDRTHERLLGGSRTSIELEQRYLRRNGDWALGTVKVVLLRGAKDCPLEFFAQVLDVSGFVGVRPEPRRWQDVLRYAQWGVVLGSADGTTLEQMNPAFARMHGYAVEELMGRPITDVFAPECRAGVAAHIERAHREGHYAFESVHLRKDGSRFPVFIDVTVARGLDGAIKYRVVNVQDISERKKTEKELQYLAGIIDSSSDAIMSKGLNGIVTSWNWGAERIFGYSAEEILGKPIDCLVPGDRLGEERMFLEQIRNGALISHFETVRRHKEGRLIDVSVTISPVRDSEGRIIGASKIARDITDRKRAQQHLQLMDFALNHVREAVYLIDEDMRFIYVNAEACRALGYTPKELLAMKVFDIDPDAKPDDLKRLKQDVDQASALTFERRHRTKDGRFVTVEITAAAFEYTGRQVAISLAHDIAARKAAETALREAEQRYRTLVENIPDFIVRFDSQCRHVYVNPSVTRALGVSAGEVLGKTVTEHLPPERRNENACLEAAIRQAFTDGAVNRAEARWELANGERFFEILHVPEKDERGRVVSVLGIARDITERKHLEEALLQRENKFRTLAENSPNVIIRYDRDCRPAYVNPAFGRETGIPAEDELLAAQDLQWTVGPRQSAQYHRATLQDVMKTGATRELLVEFSRRDTGERVSYAFRVVPESGPDNRIQGALAIGYNVTALRLVEKRLEDSHAQLRALAARLEAVREEERKRIARDIHDEMGQHLTALRMGVSMLRMKYGASAPAILQDLRELNMLVDKTIEVARHTAASLRPAPLDLGIMSALEWLVAEFTRSTGLPCTLEADEADLQLDDKRSTAIFRIAQESLTNIGRHANASRATLRLVRQGRDLLLEVRDDGKGFDPTASRPNSLGIVGMRERALMLGGELLISSAPDRSTVVMARIPSRDGGKAP
jgi:PAS domain S-box-containing protein